MSGAKKFLWGFVAVLVLLNVALIITGRSYLYKGIANTYLKGRSGPSIDEYKIFASRTIEAENPQPWPVSQNYNKGEIPADILSGMKQYQPVSFLIIKNDSIRFEKYWENFDKSSLSNSFSMAKTIVSILTGIAITEGKIKSVDQPVGDFLPGFKEGEKAKITVKHLLTMSSGIDFDEDYQDPFAYPAAAYYGRDLRKLTLKYKARKEPGKYFNYLSGDTQLLGFVVSEATGKSLSEYAEEKLWKKIGAENDALWNLDRKDGDEKAYCCFISNARDFARLGKLYMDWGKWNGEVIVDSAYVAESIKPAALIEEDGSPVKRYGYKWWLADYKGLEIFYARGILGQYIICIPEKDLIVVRLGRKRAFTPALEHPKDFYSFIDAALAITEGENTTPENFK